MRILVVGPPAAGKSTLAHAISVAISAPVHHVDALRWKAPEQRRPPREIEALVADALGGPAWVAEGSVGPTVNAFAAAADAVVILDYPRRVTLARLVRRWSQRRRVGMPDGHREVPTLFALRLNLRWRGAHRQELLRDMQATDKSVLHLTAPEPGLVEKSVSFARAQM